MAEVLERCPHCGHVGADIWRSERRPGVCVLHLICRACSSDWLTTEDTDEFMEPSRSDVKKRATTDDRANSVIILFDGEIVMDGQHERFICPGCAKEGAVYRVSLRGKQGLTCVRCLDCSHEWTVEWKSEIPKSRQS